jgi:hypothetical protein
MRPACSMDSRKQRKAAATRRASTRRCDSATVDLRECRAEPCITSQNRRDPRTSASAVDQRALPIHCLRFCFVTHGPGRLQHLGATDRHAAVKWLAASPRCSEPPPRRVIFRAHVNATASGASHVAICHPALASVTSAFFHVLSKRFTHSASALWPGSRGPARTPRSRPHTRWSVRCVDSRACDRRAGQAHPATTAASGSVPESGSSHRH